MEKNYYEVLEVDKNASDEIIGRAYKVLAKRYHPDLQEGATKIEYEEQMKKINEAYSILSDNDKRKEYDMKLQNTIITIEEYQGVLRENAILKEKLQILLNQNNTYQPVRKPVRDSVRNNVYYNSEPQYTKNNYKTKIDFIKKHLKKLGIILAVIATLILIAQIPFVKRYLIQFYENNILIKIVVDALVNTFKQSF